jgi:signal transduction histidine kinase
VLVFLNDVTDERAQQQKLHLADRMASVGEMAAGVAHEVNNPLGNIILLSRLLIEEEGIDEKTREEVVLINREAQRASTVVKNLLTFARKHEHVLAPAQINAIIDEVLKIRAYEHRVNNIEVFRNLPGDLPGVLVDHFQIQQVFLNIILNAEQAMVESNKGGTLTVSAEQCGESVKISFADNGPGIRVENLDHIFDPFFTTKEVGKGTGLGLSICYGIVQSHNGKIYASSEAGKGATFIIELPVCNRQRAAVAV